MSKLKMRQIVHDWIDYCSGKKEFADGYFYTLFMEDITIDEVEAIYETFPYSSALITKMSKFLFELKPANNGSFGNIAELDTLIKLDFAERKLIMQTQEVYSKPDIDYTFKYVGDYELVDDLILDDTFTQAFHDFMRTQKINSEKKMYLLFDALSGLTYDFDLQLFLFTPLLKTSYSGEHLFQFKKLGGIYAVTDNEVVFSQK